MAIWLLTGSFALKAQIPQQTVPADYGYRVTPGQQMPDFQMELTDGTIINTANLRGKVVMLQFTASWCSVCRKEMPHIESEIWLKYQSNDNFALYGIDLKEPLETVKKFAGDMKITYPLALDPEGKIFYTYAVEGAGVTRNVIIDKKGKIVFLTRLFKEEEFREMISVIDRLLNE
jgi:peroxiredoxin